MNSIYDNDLYQFEMADCHPGGLLEHNLQYNYIEGIYLQWKIHSFIIRSIMLLDNDPVGNVLLNYFF